MTRHSGEDEGVRIASLKGRVDKADADARLRQPLTRVRAWIDSLIQYLPLEPVLHYVASRRNDVYHTCMLAVRLSTDVVSGRTYRQILFSVVEPSHAQPPRMIDSISSGSLTAVVKFSKPSSVTRTLSAISLKSATCFK